MTGSFRSFKQKKNIKKINRENSFTLVYYVILSNFPLHFNVFVLVIHKLHILSWTGNQYVIICTYQCILFSHCLPQKKKTNKQRRCTWKLSKDISYCMFWPDHGFCLPLLQLNACGQQGFAYFKQKWHCRLLFTDAWNFEYWQSSLHSCYNIHFPW